MPNPTVPVETLVSVSRRLFISISALLALALIIMTIAAATESKFILPGVVVLCGFIGGFISLQRRLKDLTVQDLELIATSNVYTWLSPLVGAILALLLYVLFLGQLLTGDLFPTFKPDSQSTQGFASIFQQQGASYKDYAKLVFWCFVAGYSETLVINIIGRFEGASVKSLARS